jgi:sortase (surface protein transpeptidase)
MKSDGSNLITVRSRHYKPVVAFAVLVLLGLFFFGSNLVQYLEDTMFGDEGIETVASSTPFYRVVPIRLEIPAIGLDTTFTEPLGLNPDNTVMVPESYSQVGWYKNGVTPGDEGAAVILGHVDSKDGPGVFYSLGQLTVGDEVFVARADGTTATFVVTELVRYAQSDFPSERVYVGDGGADLRLVTCTGSFDRGQARYSHNLVVYAELK